MHIAATKKEEIHDLASYGFRQKSDGGTEVRTDGLALVFGESKA